MSDTADTLLEVKDLKTWFDSAAGPVRSVDGVTFSLVRGRTIGIVGESGSGKSVLARSIINILPKRSLNLAAGQVQFQGADLRVATPRRLRKLWGREIALVFQDPMTALNPVLKIGAQIVEPLRQHLGLSRAAARRRAEDLLGEVGIPAPQSRLDEYPHQLSGGMRQRVVIAIALSCRPALLIADEPTTALDVTVQKQILDLLAYQQRTQNMAMILISHDLGVVAGRTDEIAVMYAGRVVEHAQTRTLFRSMRHPYTQALLQSIPRIGYPSHTRLPSISGSPPDLVAPPSGCRFSPRCRYAQDKCLRSDPSLDELGFKHSNVDSAFHRYACFFPVGTSAGEQALKRNIEAGVSAAGTVVTPVELPTLQETVCVT